MAVLEPLRSGYYVWKYLPSIEAAAIFCIIWALATSAHIWKIWKTRGWFGIPFAVGGFSMCLVRFFHNIPFANRSIQR